MRSKVILRLMMDLLAATTTTTFPEAKHHLLKENNRQVTFDAKIPPALRVLEGELIHVETYDCYTQLITPENPDATRLQRSDLNPVTGPIHVQGAMPGDILSVTIHDIRPVGLGVAVCGPYAGQLCHLITETTTKFFELSPDRNVVTMMEEEEAHTKPQGFPQQRRRRRIGPLSFQASPMLGVIGVAPKGDAAISTMPAGKHGGNLDNKLNGIGCTIHIPVNHPGALLSLGDMHASQGDGEICGTGVEIGGHVLLSCKVLKKGQAYDEQHTSIAEVCEFPVTETATHWVTHGVVEMDIPHTTKIACEEAAKLLMGQWGFTAEEAFIFLSVKGDLGICQSCHPDKGTQIAKMMVPKIDACPTPFRILSDVD